MPPNSSSLIWLDDNHIMTGGISFVVTSDEEVYRRKKSTATDFLVIKSRKMVETTLGLFESPPRNILEIGIWQGGSVVLLDQAFRPERLVAIEWGPEPLAALDAYIEQTERRDVIKPYYGVNQADSRRLTEIARREFPAGIDLVIDDASHFYAETQASFLVLFPSLVPGGKYVIEDWGWGHHDRLWKSGYFANKPTLTNLLVEIGAIVAARPEIASEIWVSSDMIVVTRGGGPLPYSGNELDPGGLTTHFRSRGLKIRPRL